MNIELFCQKYNFGNLIKQEKLIGGLMHKMYKVETDKGIYCIKVLNPEVMAREEAYSNFVISESVANLAKNNGIPVSSALEIDGDYLKEYDGFYYMVFDFVNGKTLKDDEITVEHCRKIGRILARIHALDYHDVGLVPNVVKYKRLYDWEGYMDNPNFEKMGYKEIYIENYKKLNSILKRANERFNATNINQTICHLDMDPKNVMWNGDEPIVIDWECAGVANPERELLEDALCWSGFLSDNFDEEKFIAIFKEYSATRSIDGIDWYDVICGNLVGRIGWLKYNVERSLGIVSNDPEEMKLAENEVAKTINEINRYLILIGRMDELINSLVTEKVDDYTYVIEAIIKENDFLKGLEYKEINAGFTNTIFIVGNYVIRICVDPNNEERFKNEIAFYERNKDNDKLPKLYAYDISKKKIGYCYEVIENVSGKTLYEVWPKLSEKEQEAVVDKMVAILRSFQNQGGNEYDFGAFLKNKILEISDRVNIDENTLNMVIGLIDEYFRENIFGLIHGDLHFDNFIYDGKKLSLIDFERCMTAPIDYELRIFTMYDIMPWLWAGLETDMMTFEMDYSGLLPMILMRYPEVGNIPNIRERLEIYAIIELLDNYSHTKEESVMNAINSKIDDLVKDRKLVKRK